MFCCKNGKIDLPKPEMPEKLKDLLQNNKDFLNNIRLYNNSVCMATFGVDGKIKDEWSTFQFQGRCYHYIGDLKPAENDPRKFAQWYIHDGGLSPDEEAEGRIAGQPEGVRCRLDKDVVKTLQKMLAGKNQLVKQLKFVANLPQEQIEGKKFVLKAEGRPDGSHRRSYNLPGLFNNLFLFF